jgi:uncharacterized protein (TIGR02246 family)
MASDDAGIRALMAEWRRASHAGDVEALLAMLDEDVVFLTPGNPPMGRKEFEAGFRRFSAKATVDAEQDIRDVEVAGDLACAWSHLRVTMTPKQGGKPLVTEGYVLTVFRRRGGRWRIARDANLMPQAGNPDKV